MFSDSCQVQLNVTASEISFDVLKSLRNELHAGRLPAGTEGGVQPAIAPPHRTPDHQISRNVHTPSAGSRLLPGSAFGAEAPEPTTQQDPASLQLADNLEAKLRRNTPRRPYPAATSPEILAFVERKRRKNPGSPGPRARTSAADRDGPRGCRSGGRQRARPERSVFARPGRHATALPVLPSLWCSSDENF